MKQNFNDKIKRLIILFLIIFQSLGIRFFDGQGILIILILFFFNISFFFNINVKDVKTLLIVSVFLLINTLLNNSFYLHYLIQILYLFSVYLFLLKYRLIGFKFLVFDLFKIIEILCFHSFFGYVIYLITPENFVLIPDTLNSTFYNLFYISKSNFNGFNRNTGLFWEPGVLQLIANLYIFYCIKFKLGYFKIFIGLIIVLTTFSTTGFLILLINFFYFYKNIDIKTYKFSFIFSIFLIIYSYNFIVDNINDKIYNSNTSKTIRVRDINIGFELIKENPLIGLGYLDNNLLSENKTSIKIEKKYFSKSWKKEFGSMAGGFTNGLIGFFISYGIPFGLITFYFFWNNMLTGTKQIDKIVFNMILFITLFSEPISSTPFFLIFPLSYIIFNNKKQHPNDRNFYNHSYF